MTHFPPTMPKTFQNSLNSCHNISTNYTHVALIPFLRHLKKKKEKSPCAYIPRRERLFPRRYTHSPGRRVCRYVRERAEPVDRLLLSAPIRFFLFGALARDFLFH